MTKLIVNVRRSGDMGEVITVSIDFRTPTERLHLLRERLTEWVNNQSRDFSTGFDVRVSDIVDMNKLVLSMWLPHKGNWQDLGKRFQRKTKVRRACVYLCKACASLCLPVVARTYTYARFTGYPAHQHHPFFSFSF